MNRKGQFSLIAALLVAVILIATVIITYSAIRSSPVSDMPQVLSAIDETNFALKQVLGFTIGYYGSVLKVTGNVTYARILAENYLYSGLINIANMHPDWGASLKVDTISLQARWFEKISYSMGDLAVSYNLTGLGIYGISYGITCKLNVNVTGTVDNKAYLNITKDENEPLINLGKSNFRFYKYDYDSLTWELVNPTEEPEVTSNGMYSINLPYGVDSDSFMVQVEDQRGIIVTAASFTRYTYTLAWKPNITLISGESFEGNWPPSGWTATGSWGKKNAAAYDGAFSAGVDGQGGGASGDLTTFDLNCTDASSIYVEFWYRDEGCEINEFLLQYYNGNAWITIADLGNTTLENQWLHYQQKVTDSQFFKSNFKIRWSAVGVDNNEHAYIDHVIVKKEMSLLTPNEPMVVELLQNGTMRWLGQNLQLTTQAKPIPPIPVKSVRVNQTINGVNREVPFQVEDWASDYKVPLGLASNMSVFGNRHMLVFLVNRNVSKVTLWWDGSDTATQTPYAYVNRYFYDDPSTRTLSNGILSIQLSSSGFHVTATVGSVTHTADLMRINRENDTTNPEWAYTIYNGVVRDIVHGEPEFSGGADENGTCQNFYSHVVLTLPANATYYTYQLRLIFLNSTDNPRLITDLCPIQVNSPEMGVFGSTSSSSSYTSVSANYMYGSVFTSPSVAVVASSITFRGRSDSGTGNVKCLIVRHTDMQIIAVTNPISITTSTGWRTAAFPSPPILSPNTEYILMIIPDRTIRLYYTAGSTNQGHYDTTNNYNTPTDPTDIQHNNNQYSIYCNYNILRTENGTLNAYPIISNEAGVFYNLSTTCWQHRWSQISFTLTQGVGIMFRDTANHMLYTFDSIAGAKTGALKVSPKTIELCPVTSMHSASFTHPLDIVWYGAVVTFDGTTPIYKLEGGAPTGLWILVEYPPVITVTAEG
ncbi:MAG: hypothetical protein ACPL1Z_06825 [Candidatus Bathyarchaeales archaeon]